MKILGFVFLISIFSFQSNSQEYIQKFIFGGQIAKSTEPVALSTVAIVGNDERVYCSAVLIANNMALTAAHCVDKAGMDLIFSNNVVNGFLAKNKRHVVDHKVHPEYIDGKQNDIAVLYFDGGLVGNYKPATLPAENYPIAIGEKLLAAGYGTNRPKVGYEGVGILRKTILPIFNLNYESKILVLDQSGNTGVCYGDSGSPLYQVQSDNSLVVVGIADTVEKSNCKPKSSYAMISGYLTWILKDNK